MKRGLIWIVLSCLMVISMVLASCNTSTSSTRSTSTPTFTPTATPTSKPTTTPTVTAATTTTATVHWWDKLGKPQYGGEMVFRSNKDITNFDPYNAQTLMSIESAWMEKLFADDWTVDLAVFDFSTSYRPDNFEQGLLAESWEFTDASTFVIHLRKGIHWQDIPPANSREFIADDVAFHFNRLYGLGSGFTKPAPAQSTVVAWQSLISVSATDKYTVIFKWKTPNPELITETIHGINSANDIANPDAVKLWGDVNDWHHAIGTGAFILKDFVSGSSATLIKNPNYWGYDERYPQNKVPYVDTLKYLIIPDDATALAGLRTGKIDFIDQMSFQNAQSMQKTNPEILQTSISATTAMDIDPRNDVAPFKDIRVRKAMQMAIDLPTIAKSYYNGTCPPYPSSLTSMYMKGWGFPYDQWPQDLKDEYAYNPTAAKKLLADAGYPNGFKTDIVADTATDMDLLQIVKSYFANIGIDMEIRTLDSASWVAFVQTGHKHDQLAQRSSGLLGTTAEPLRQLNRLQTGYSVNWAMISDPVFDAFYPKAMAITNIDDIKKVLRDANEYVARQHFCISLLSPKSFALYQAWLKAYDGRNSTVSGTNSVPQFVSFYGARFWIDQSMKKSMGH